MSPKPPGQPPKQTGLKPPKIKTQFQPPQKKTGVVQGGHAPKTQIANSGTSNRTPPPKPAPVGTYQYQPDEVFYGTEDQEKEAIEDVSPNAIPERSKKKQDDLPETIDYHGDPELEGYLEDEDEDTLDDYRPEALQSEMESEDVEIDDDVKNWLDDLENNPLGDEIEDEGVEEGFQLEDVDLAEAEKKVPNGWTHSAGGIEEPEDTPELFINRENPVKRRKFSSAHHDKLYSIAEKGLEHVKDPAVKADFLGVFKDLTKNYSPKLVEMMLKEGSTFQFFDNLQTLKEKASEVSQSVREYLEKGNDGAILGLFLRDTNTVLSDGIEDHIRGRIYPKEIRSTDGVQAHEQAHLIDKLFGHVSMSKEWIEAFHEEVNLPDSPLSIYAKGDDVKPLPVKHNGDINFSLLEQNHQAHGLTKEQAKTLQKQYYVQFSKEVSGYTEDGFSLKEAMALARDQVKNDVEKAYKKAQYRNGYTESFAEFMRLLAKKNVDLKKVEAKFPKMSAVIKAFSEYGIWPEEDKEDEFKSQEPEVTSDGVIADVENGEKEIVAFEPNQIKSADKNKGRFDPSNPNIYAMQIKNAKRKMMEAVGELEEEPEYELSESGNLVFDVFNKSIEGSDKLSNEQKQNYSNSMKTVLSRIPDIAIDQIMANVKGAFFSPDSKDLESNVYTHLFVRYFEDRAEKVFTDWKENALKGGILGGLFDPNLGNLFLDGDSLYENFDIGLGKKGKLLVAHSNAHELGHGIDGINLKYSSSREWLDVWHSELRTGRLCDYATTADNEGFAEFCRVVYGGGFNLREIELTFPKCAEFFKDNGLWPRMRKEEYEERLDKQQRAKDVEDRKKTNTLTRPKIETF